MNKPAKPDIRAEVEKTLRSRLELRGLKPSTKRALDAECHFLCGAMAAINAIYPNANPDKISDMIDPAWVFAPLTGRSVLEDKK
jgi:hypothetical protein